MPAPHHSVFYRPDALPAAQLTASKHWNTSVAQPLVSKCWRNLKLFTLAKENNHHMPQMPLLWNKQPETANTKQNYYYYYTHLTASFPGQWGKRWQGLGWQWHQLDHMQTTCTLLQTDKHTNSPTPHHTTFTGRMLFMTLNQQCQSTEGTPNTKQKSQQWNTHPFHVVKCYTDLFGVYFKSFALKYINLHTYTYLTKHQKKEQLTSLYKRNKLHSATTRFQ